MATILDRLKQRKLGQWVLAYLAGAWFVMQLVEVVGDRWGLPVVMQRGIDFALVFGLFVVAVLAWYHGEKGRQKVGGVELLILAAIFGLAGTLLPVFWQPGDGSSDGVGRTRMAVILDDPRPSIAVLPFANMSSVEETLYFADGIHDDLLTQLSKISGLRVISRTSVMAYRETNKTIPEIVAELGVDAVLEGGVQHVGGRIRINAQLIDGATDAHLWAEQYDRPYSVETLFNIQSDITHRIAAALEAELLASEELLIGRAPTTNEEAYDLFVRGKDLRTREGQEAARAASRLFAEARDLDPDFLEAHAWESTTWSELFWQHRGGGAALDSAEAAADRALALDPEHPLSLHAKGFWYYRAGDYGPALDHLRRAEQADPRNPRVLVTLGGLLTRMGQFDEGIGKIELAVALDPLDDNKWLTVAERYPLLHRFDDAKAAYRRRMELAPDKWVDDRMWLAQVYLMEGDMDSVRVILEPVIEGGHCDFGCYQAWFPYRAAVRALGPEFRERALRMTAASQSPENRGPNYHLTQMLLSEIEGSAEQAQAHRDSAQTGVLGWSNGFLEGVEESPDGATGFASLAFVLATAGLHEQAKDFAAQAVERLAFEDDRMWFYQGFMQRAAAAFVLAGAYAEAVDVLRQISGMNSWITAPVLRLDPYWAPLQGYPAFEALVEELEG